MKETFLDALMYLFENYVEETKQALDAKQISDDMLKNGFALDEIDTALNWLDDLNELQEKMQQGSLPSPQSFRIYSADECNKLPDEVRGYLWQLESQGILNSLSRELVINRAMVMLERIVDLSTLKWIVLMILFNQPELKERLIIMEEMVFTEGAVKH